ncbi:MAG: hypothetical protein JKY62_01985 [Desulfocapsa sp.]|nr:hypothetical protein [Desulfocapsa sp.]
MVQTTQKQTIRNLTPRLVSFRGNSGQTWHLSPNSSLEVLGSEIVNNAKCEKLKAKNVIDICLRKRAKSASPKNPKSTPPKNKNGNKTASITDKKQ